MIRPPEPDEPVHPARQQTIDRGQLPFAIFARVGQKEREAGGASLLLDATDHACKAWLSRVRDHQAEYTRSWPRPGRDNAIKGSSASRQWLARHAVASPVQRDRVPFSTCDTVETDTPARRATSTIVTTRKNVCAKRLYRSVRRGSCQGVDRHALYGGCSRAPAVPAPGGCIG